MPRLARSTQENDYFHIITRGINKENIFIKGFYKNQILKYYFDKKYQRNILSYAVMDNHSHFMIRVDNIKTLAKIMKNINLRYSLFYNEIEDRSGHVFQNRYISVPIKSERQIFETLRYIHNNPVFAGLSEFASMYKFSSYNNFFGKKKDLISDIFKDLIKDNFKNKSSFGDFHKERLFVLQKDTKEDLALAKKFIYQGLKNKINDENKLEYIKKLNCLGFSKTELAKFFKVSRNMI